jgi:hypothetical protein
VSKKLNPLFLLSVIGCIIVLISCSKKSIDSPEYYMKAQINGMDWSADKDGTWFQMDYDNTLDYHVTNIFSRSEKLLDSIQYKIDITSRHYPKNGKYFFDNTSPFIPYDGAAAIVFGWVKKGSANESFTTQSFNGFVEILEINKTYMKGRFEFDSKRTQGSTAIDTFQVRNGSFNIPLTVVSGKERNP